ncbi:MAG: hypothetical protein AAFV29_22320 [Myxococcota bacterium]
MAGAQMIDLRYIFVAALSCTACRAATPSPTSEVPRSNLPTTEIPSTKGPVEGTLAQALSRREVIIPANGIVLKGTLTLSTKETSPRPGLLLVHGSGPQSRDVEVPGQLAMTFGAKVRVFADIANALAKAGYAVLRYDKRTCGSFNNCAQNDYPPVASDLTIDLRVLP